MMGGEFNPYLISNYGDLCLLRDLVDNGNDMSGLFFKQTEDICFPDDENWNPIGEIDNENGQATSFAGVYDGHGHILSNIHCYNKYAGFFSYLSGEVWNLGVENSTFEGSCIGGITSYGNENAKIINCYSYADCVATDRAGGITDNCDGITMFCWNLGTQKVTSTHGIESSISSCGNTKVLYCYSNENSGYEEVIDDYYNNLWQVYYYQKHSKADELAISDTFSGVNKDIFENVNICRSSIAFMVVSDDRISFSSDFDYQPEIFADEKQKNEEFFFETYTQRYNFEGDGTKECPFIISSYDDLCRLRDCVDLGVSYRGYYFRQNEDIVMPNGINWEPIGDLAQTMAFCGVYNGSGHIISNIYCDNDYAGLFSYLDGTVINLGIENGGFTGATIGSITSHGGVNAKIINCYNRATVTGKCRAGGITDNYPGLILYTINLGEVSVTDNDGVAAGITSYGSASIDYSYTNQGCIADAKTFSGNITGCACDIDEHSGEVFGGEIYRGFWKYDSVICYDDLVYFNYGKNCIYFDQHYIPKKIIIGQYMAWTPNIILLIICITFSVFTYVYFRKNSKNKKVSTNNEDVLSSMNSKRMQFDTLFGSKTRRRQVGTILLFVILFTFAFNSIFFVLDSKTTAGKRNLTAYENDKENRLADVIFCGSSTLSCNVELAELWDEYGIAGYLVGAGGMDFVDVYYRLCELDNDDYPYMLVIDSASFRHRGKLSGNEYWLENILSLKASFNKIRYVVDSLEPEQWDDYILKFPLFHGNYNALNKYSFLNYSSLGENDKGTWTIFYGNKYDAELKSPQDTVDYYAIDESRVFYFQKIVELCDEKNIELLVVKTPDSDRENNQKVYNTVETLLEEENVTFLNMNYYDEEIGLTKSDFYYDNLHLNIEGARKTADFLGEYLLSNYYFTDHRGDTAYSTWDLFSANREDLYLKQMDVPQDYFRELSRDDDNKSYTVIPYKVSMEEIQANTALNSYLSMISYESIDGANVEYNKKLSFEPEKGGESAEIEKRYDSCSIEINGDEYANANLSGSGLILIVYDEITHKIADISFLENSAELKMTHVY